MIPFASQRGGGQDLAAHLMNDYDNELAEVSQVRGAVARDLHGAFKEWEVLAETLTRCRKYLYSLSINPDPAQGPLTRDQYLDYIGRTEDALGLRGQPRAVVFHIKEGREHCHVVWSRINADKQKAVHIAFDREKLMAVTREFARDHGLSLPGGYDKSRQVGQVSLYEQAQLREGGLSKEDHKRQVTEAWQQSDDPRSFVQALAERGYILATGKRPYILIDLYGGMNSLPKLIDDKAVRTRDVCVFLEDDFPVDGLPSVEEAQALVAAHRKVLETSNLADQLAAKRDELQHAQRDRRRPLEAECAALKERHRELRESLRATHRAERDRLRADHVAGMRAIKKERFQNRPTGLAAFLGRVTGVALIQRKVQRFQDARRTTVHLEQRAKLTTKQAEENRSQEQRIKIQMREIERRAKALDKVDARELAALVRDQKRNSRVASRDDPEVLPSLVEIAELDGPEQRWGGPSLQSAFDRATTEREAVDLLTAFERAARGQSEANRDDASGSGLDDARPPDPHRPDGRSKGRSR